jgi:hypothetical protein
MVLAIILDLLKSLRIIAHESANGQSALAITVALVKSVPRIVFTRLGGKAKDVARFMHRI